jgi:hypothetical protein
VLFLESYFVKDRLLQICYVFVLVYSNSCCLQCYCVHITLLCLESNINLGMYMRSTKSVSYLKHIFISIFCINCILIHSSCAAS